MGDGLCQVAARLDVCAAERSTQIVGRAARPEQDADREAHGAADCNVLDPQQPELPSDRHQQVEEHEQREREGSLAGEERNRRRCETRDQHHDREQDPEHHGVGADHGHECPADDEAERGAHNRSGNRLPCAERVRTQHRERSEHDPEAVLDGGQVGDEHRQRQAGCSAQAVVQPRRARLRVGERSFPGGADRPRESGGLTSEQPLGPGAAAGGRGVIGVCRDLLGDVGEFLRPEARVERRNDRCRVILGGLGRAPHWQSGGVRLECVQRLA